MILHSTLSFALVVKDLNHTRICSKLLGGENGAAWNNKFQRSSQKEQAKNKWWRLSSTVSQRGHKGVTYKPHLLSLSRVGILSRAATHVINVCFGIYPWNQTEVASGAKYSKLKQRKRQQEVNAKYYAIEKYSGEKSLFQQASQEDKLAAEEEWDVFPLP